MKPPFSYYGGKSRIAEEISWLLPPHDIYLEPFLGSGAVFFAKRPSRHEILNDINGDIVTFFRVLREQPDQLEEACRLTPYSREEYDLARTADSTAVSDLERARLWWVMVNQSFAKTARRNTGWSRTIAQNHSAPATISNRLDRFLAVAERLTEAMIENRPALELIGDLGHTDRADRTLIYLDPPYLAETRRVRSNSGSSAGKDYEMDMGHVDDHVALATALLATPAKVLLSGYHSEVYDEMFTGWDRHEISVVGSAGRWMDTDERRTEVLWSNYRLDIPRQLELA